MDGILVNTNTNRRLMQNGGGKKHRRQQVLNATEDCKPMNQDDLIIRYAYPNLEVGHRPYTITRNPTNPGPQTTRRKLGHNSRVTCPALVIHGTDDEVTDFSHGVSVYERCPAAVEPLWVAGAGHNDVELHAA